MNLESRKINLINWISSIQEENILTQMEDIQKKNNDWWDIISEEDKEAINDGLNQLDRGEYTIRSQVKKQIEEKYKF